MNENKLTPEAEAHIKANGYTKDLTVPAACILINGIERAFTDPALLKAQGLVKDPGMISKVDFYGQLIKLRETTGKEFSALDKNYILELVQNIYEFQFPPTPPKTEV